MNKNDTNISLASYLNDITFHFYEDLSIVSKCGRQLGIDPEKDYFRALSFLYPMDVIVDYDMKLDLQTVLAPIIQCSAMNSSIHSKQFLFSDKGVVLFLIGHTKEELLASTSQACDLALDLLKEAHPDQMIRIGIGTMETGLDGIELTYQNAVKAVNVGEKFKKERRVLDYIGMEIYSAINAMVLAHGESLIKSILKQLTDEEQTVLGRYYKCKEQIPATAEALKTTEDHVRYCLEQIKERTGLDVNDTEDNFKLNFIMIAKRVLEKEKKRR